MTGWTRRTRGPTRAGGHTRVYSPTKNRARISLPTPKSVRGEREKHQKRNPPGLMSRTRPYHRMAPLREPGVRGKITICVRRGGQGASGHGRREEKRGEQNRTEESTGTCRALRKLTMLRATYTHLAKRSSISVHLNGEAENRLLTHLPRRAGLGILCANLVAPVNIDP